MCIFRQPKKAYKINIERREGAEMSRARKSEEIWRLLKKNYSYHIMWTVLVPLRDQRLYSKAYT